MNKFTSSFNKLLDLIYPRTCVACQNPLIESQAPICMNCLLDLPVIGLEPIQQQKTVQKFDGRVNISNAIAYLKFEKGNVTQKIIYALKYKGKYELGVWLGRMLGNELIKLRYQDKFSLLLPIPLHYTKLKARGYNQAQAIVEGLSEVLNISSVPNGLIRVLNNTSQTHKNRFERYQNTTKIFEVSTAIDFVGKRVCIVDDVLTTGATLEAAAEVLLEAGCIEVSIITIASAY